MGEKEQRSAEDKQRRAEDKQRRAEDKQRRAEDKQRSAEDKQRRAEDKQRRAEDKQRRAEGYRKRDEQIIKQLRSAKGKVREEGWERVDETYEKPVASVLTTLALSCVSAAYETILDVEVFDDIWQETKMHLFVNIHKEDFKFRGNLLAYLVKIARCLTVVRWKKERKYVQFPDGQDDFVEGSAKAGQERSELFNDIRRFFGTLNKDDQAALRIGMRLATDDPSRRMSMKVFVEKMRRAGRWKGNYRSISRRYGRLRDKLREFLRKRGHYV